VEPLFAEAKTLHGLSRFRPRGIEKVNIEGLMVAAGQNLKRLFKYSGMRPAPLALAVLASALLALRRAFVPSAGSGPSRSAASPTYTPHFFNTLRCWRCGLQGLEGLQITGCEAIAIDYRAQGLEEGPIASKSASVNSDSSQVCSARRTNHRAAAVTRIRREVIPADSWQLIMSACVDRCEKHSVGSSDVRGH
jgi:hypothetical protein